MASLNDFLPRIKPHVPGCPDVTIKNSLLHILRDICKKTLLWERDVYQALIANFDEYTIAAPEGSEIAIIRRVQDEDGDYLDNKLIPQHNRGSGKPRFFNHTRRNRIQFYPKPGDDALYTIRVCLMPSLDATEIPDDVFSEVVEYAVWGVLADLQSMMAEDWANVDLAILNGRRYESFLNERRISSLAGYTAADVRAKRQRFV